MSLNISNTLLRVATVTMTFPLNLLTVKQHNSLTKMIRTGVVKGWGVPARIAVAVLRTKELPYIHHNNHWVSFSNVPLDPKHPLRELLLLAHAASKLDKDFEDAPRWKTAQTPPYSYTRALCEFTSDQHLYLKADAVKLAFKNARDIHDVTLGEEITAVMSTPDKIQEYV